MSTRDVCQWDTGSATGCQPACSAPATVVVTHQAYRGPSHWRLCARHARLVSARIWPDRVISETPIGSTLLADIAAIARPRDDTHTRRTGRAIWDGSTGEWVLRYGHASTTIGGPSGLVDMIDAIERHGMRADTWQHETDTGRIMCTLWERDWTLAP